MANTFEKIWNQGLIAKMIKAGFPEHQIQLIRSFQVKADDQMSMIRTITSEVTQGSVMGHLLFNIYMVVIPMTKATESYIYADDVALTAIGKGSGMTAKLQRRLVKIEKWSRD
ncbi:hypothetical protein YQE_01539, partial [Dendroctonus ponderosae]